MIKTFCDCCGKEICKANNNELLDGGLGRKGAIVSPKKRRESDALKVEVIVSTNGTSNNGHYCKHCIIDALTADDDRPVAAEPDRESEVEKFLMTCPDKGRIVCSGDLTTFQIAEARAENRFYVNRHGFGFTMLPWSLTTMKDKEREALLESKLGVAKDA